MFLYCGVYPVIDVVSIARGGLWLFALIVLMHATRTYICVYPLLVGNSYQGGRVCYVHVLKKTAEFCLILQCRITWWKISDDLWMHASRTAVHPGRGISEHCQPIPWKLPYKLYTTVEQRRDTAVLPKQHLCYRHWILYCPIWHGDMVQHPRS